MAKLTIKKVEYDIPAVTLGQLRRGLLIKMQDADKLIKDGQGLEWTMAVGEIVSEVMCAKYTDKFTSDDVLDAIDFGNASSVFQAILGAAGIEPVGEAKAATEVGT